MHPEQAAKKGTHEIIHLAHADYKELFPGFNA